MEGQLGVLAVVPLGETQEVRLSLLRGLDEFATVPQVLSLEETARGGGRETGEIFKRIFGCGCGGPGNGIFAFSKRKKRQTGFGGEQAGFGGEKETQERIFNLRCITAFVTGRKKVTNTK